MNIYNLGVWGRREAYQAYVIENGTAIPSDGPCNQ